MTDGLQAGYSITRQSEIAIFFYYIEHKKVIASGTQSKKQQSHTHTPTNSCYFIIGHI